MHPLCRVGITTILLAAGCSSPAQQEVDPVHAASASSGISSSDITRWNAGITTEQDPTFSASPAAAITADDLERLDAALTTEVDPAFGASVAAAITADDVTRWDNHDHDDRYVTTTAAEERFALRGTRQHLMVNPTDFVSRLPTLDIDYLGGQGIRFGGTETTWNLIAAVHLPDGAVVNEMTCFLRDNDPTQDVTDVSEARFFSFNLVTDAAQNLDPINLGTEGVSGAIARSVSNGTVVVENQTSQFILQVTIVLAGSDGDFFDPMFRGCSLGFDAP